MEVWSVTDPLFREYGRIVEGLPTASRLLARLAALTPVPEGVEYVASDAALEALPEAAWLREHVFGGMPIQLGWCNGHNSRLNCLEYHRDSEVDAGATDFILLLAKREQIVAHSLDTSKVRAFFCPAGTIVELYATTLHYTPCGVSPDAGFQMLCVLPRGTNGEKPAISAQSAEDSLLFACNKWLLAHPESAEAAQGAHIGLTGPNLDLGKEKLDFKGCR